jgi:hypothetical protein
MRGVQTTIIGLLAGLGKGQNPGNSGDGNAQTACDADGFQVDLLLSFVAAVPAAQRRYRAGASGASSPQDEIRV